MCYSENKLNGIKHETISSMKFKKLKLISGNCRINALTVNIIIRLQQHFKA